MLLCFLEKSLQILVVVALLTVLLSFLYFAGHFWNSHRCCLAGLCTGRGKTCRFDSGDCSGFICCHCGELGVFGCCESYCVVIFSGGMFECVPEN